MPSITESKVILGEIGSDGGECIPGKIVGKHPNG